MKIMIRDTNPYVAEACWKATQDLEMVNVHCSPIFDTPAQAIVSPANSFGFMDGGIDALYIKLFGAQVQERVFRFLKTRPFGELPVGDTMMMPLSPAQDPNYQKDAKGKPMNWPKFKYEWLLFAPTMRVPMKIVDPTSVYITMRAIVSHSLTRKLESIVMPGLGTGCGKLDHSLAAKAMAHGIIDARKAAAGMLEAPDSWQAAQARHYKFWQVVESDKSADTVQHEKKTSVKKGTQIKV